MAELDAQSVIGEGGGCSPANGALHANWLRGTPLPWQDDHADSLAEPSNLSNEDDDQVAFSSSMEQRLLQLRRDVRHHDSILAALQHDRHEHCENLAVVYAELEKVLNRIRLIPLQIGDGSMAPSMLQTVGGSQEDLARRAEGGGADISAPLSKAMASTSDSEHPQPHHSLQQFQDRVYDVLLDYRQQIDRNGRETSQRISAIEDALEQIRMDLRDTRSALTEVREERKLGLQDLRQRVEEVAVRQDAQQHLLKTRDEQEDTSTARAFATIRDEIVRLSGDSKAWKDRQSQQYAALEKQVRSLRSSQQMTEESIEAHTQSITQLQTQDSLEGAFHEVKDWLGDLEKRIVSRGELLQWTESLQSEIAQVRRVFSGAALKQNSSFGVTLDAHQS